MDDRQRLKILLMAMRKCTIEFLAALEEYLQVPRTIPPHGERREAIYGTRGYGDMGTRGQHE